MDTHNLNIPGNAEAYNKPDMKGDNVNDDNSIGTVNKTSETETDISDIVFENDYNIDPVAYIDADMYGGPEGWENFEEEPQDLLTEESITIDDNALGDNPSGDYIALYDIASDDDVTITGDHSGD